MVPVTIVCVCAQVNHQTEELNKLVVTFVILKTRKLHVLSGIWMPVLRLGRGSMQKSSLRTHLLMWKAKRHLPMFLMLVWINVSVYSVHFSTDCKNLASSEGCPKEEQDRSWASRRGLNFFTLFLHLCFLSLSRHLLSFRSIPISAGVKTSLEEEAKTSTYENKHTCCTCCTCHPLPNTASTHAQRWSVEKHSMYNKYSKEKHTHTYWTPTTIMYNYNERVGSCGRLPIFRTRRNDSEQTMI